MAGFEIPNFIPEADRKKIEKRLSNPWVRKIVEWEYTRNKPTEVFRLDDDGKGRPMFFNVSMMKEFALDNLEVFAMPLDFDRAQHLIETEAIDPEHLKNHTIRNNLEPIIVCRGLLGGDQIIDGAHRFVALHLGAAHFGLEPPIPAYVFKKRDWKPFVISRSAAQICGFEGA